MGKGCGATWATGRWASEKAGMWMGKSWVREAMHGHWESVQVEQSTGGTLLRSMAVTAAALCSCTPATPLFQPPPSGCPSPTVQNVQQRPSQAQIHHRHVTLQQGE